MTELEYCTDRFERVRMERKKRKVYNFNVGPHLSISVIFSVSKMKANHYYPKIVGKKD